MTTTSFDIRILATTFCLIAMFQTGCLLNHSNHTVVRQNEPLRRITFESEQSRAVFEQSVSQALKDRSNRSSASFSIPFLVGLEKTKSIATNAIRNDVMAMFDIDGDAHISDYEASLQNQ
ncbi:MAG: hypothetical protein AAF623_19600 [Planctomycetota bacterium]